MERKEKLLGFLTNQAKVPHLPEEIAIMLGAEGEIDEILKYLDELLREGKVLKGKKGRYEVAKRRGLYSGIYRHNPKGFGFVSPDEGEDFFISDKNSGGAYTGDVVLVSEIKEGKHSREGIVEKILERKNETVVAIYKNGWAKACDASLDMKIKITNPSKRHNGCRVAVKITDYKKPLGEVLVNLGNAGEIESRIRAIMFEHAIPEEFPSEVLSAAETIDKRISAEEYAKRKDLRNIKTITIDGADARDLDDAISLMKNGENFCLYVHIADVAHFVKAGDAIDREAFSRGTSCYFPGSVSPMLPPVLSNGLCSLNPREEKMALTTMMVIDKNGSVLSYEISESVIKSDYRMEYSEVTGLLEDEKHPLWEKYADIKDMLFEMLKLMKILREERFQKGSIDFSIPEPKIILDENGRAEDVVLSENTISNMMIEEFMLCCNKTLAEHAFWAQIPFAYRVHEAPSGEKIEEFRKFISLFGLKIPGKATGRRLMSLLENIKGLPEERSINTLLLRSMAKARYDGENLGHFGLGAPYYCHFTSPIRRYPDLFCHRAIKESLRGGDLKEIAHICDEVSKHSSERECEAEWAERDAVRLKMCEYMEGHIGEEFDAVISSVTGFGFFAELENGIEGLVRAEDIEGDFYVFDKEHLELRGERRKGTFKIGDKVKILVASVDTEAGYIDFLLGRHKWNKK